jgi:hypothetical protein
VGINKIGLWRLSSEGAVTSKDVNDHFGFLLDRLLPHQAVLRDFAATGEGSFIVFWESSYLYAGTGPLNVRVDMASAVNWHADL